MAIAFLCVFPAAPQQANLLGPADQRGQALRGPAIEASSSPAFACDAPQHRRIGNSLEFTRPEVVVVECGARKTTGQFGHHHGIWRRHSLNSCRQIQCLTDGNPFLRTALTDQFANHHQARGDADPDLRLDRQG